MLETGHIMTETDQKGYRKVPKMHRKRGTTVILECGTLYHCFYLYWLFHTRCAYNLVRNSAIYAFYHAIIRASSSELEL
jgi:hypothetical protein